MELIKKKRGQKMEELKEIEINFNQDEEWLNAYINFMEERRAENEQQ